MSESNTESNKKDTQVTESTETTVSETGSGSASQTTERAAGGRVAARCGCAIG